MRLHRPFLSLMFLMLIFALGISLAFQTQNKKRAEVSHVSLNPEITISKANCPSEMQFVRIKDVEADQEGNVFLLDDVGKHVLKFNASGKFLIRFELSEIEMPSDLIVASDGTFYVMDGLTRNVWKYTNLGKRISNFKVDLKYPFPFGFKGILGPHDELILTGYRDGKILHVYDAKGNLMRSFGDPIAPMPGSLSDEQLVAEVLMYSNGFVYYVQRYTHEIRKCEYATGKEIGVVTRSNAQWEPPMIGQYGVIAHFRVSGISVTQSGFLLNFWLMDRKAFVDVFDSKGRFIECLPAQYELASTDEKGKLYCVVIGMPWRSARLAVRSVR